MADPLFHKGNQVRVKLDPEKVRHSWDLGEIKDCDGLCFYVISSIASGDSWVYALLGTYAVFDEDELELVAETYPFVTGEELLRQLNRKA